MPEFAPPPSPDIQAIDLGTDPSAPIDTPEVPAPFANADTSSPSVPSAEDLVLPAPPAVEIPRTVPSRTPLYRPEVARRFVDPLRRRVAAAAGPCVVKALNPLVNDGPIGARYSSRVLHAMRNRPADEGAGKPLTKAQIAEKRAAETDAHAAYLIRKHAVMDIRAAQARAARQRQGSGQDVRAEHHQSANYDHGNTTGPRGRHRAQQVPSGPGRHRRPDFDEEARRRADEQANA